MKLKYTLGILAGLTFSLGGVDAAIIMVGTQIGIAPGPNSTNDVGNDWNDFTATGTTDSTIHNLIGENLDGVSVQFLGGGINDAGENDWVGLSSSGGSAPAEFVDSVTTDLLFNNLTITITGLDASLTYDIFSVSQGGGSGFDERNDTHTVTGDAGSVSSTLNRGDSRENGSFHTFLGVSPDSSGQIIFATTGIGNNPAFNGLLINAVPEPCTTALLGLGGLTLILRRRR